MATSSRRWWHFRRSWASGFECSAATAGADAVMDAFLGIDVGTGSVRAGIFDRAGRRLGMGVHPIQIFRPEEDFVEQSSDDIWSACGRATRAALSEAGIAAETIRGIGFDATCSLVVLD